MYQECIDCIGTFTQHHHARPSTTAVLLPPKANELLSTASRACSSMYEPLAARLSRGIPRSGSPSHICGGIWPFPKVGSSINQRNAASIAPAAPSRCPVIDFVELQ